MHRPPAYELPSRDSIRQKPRSTRWIAKAQFCSKPLVSHVIQEANSTATRSREQTMTQDNSSLSKAETILFILAFAAIGAAIGLLIETSPPNGMIGFALGGLVGMIIGAVATLVANRRNDAPPDNSEAANSIPAPSPTNSTSDPINSHLTIKDVYSEEDIPVQVEILISYMSPSKPSTAQEDFETARSNSAAAPNAYSDPLKREEVVKSLVTTAVRRYALTQAIDELETSRAFEAMGHAIVEEVNPTLAHWPLEILIANVEEIRLPDDVVAGQVTRLLREWNAQLERQIEAARVEALHKKIQALTQSAENTCRRARESGKGRKQQPRFVLRQLLDDIKSESKSEDPWPSCLEQLFASLDDAVLDQEAEEA